MATDSSNSQKDWYLKQIGSDAENGPYSGSDLLNYAAAGTIDAQTLVRSERGTKNEWVSARRLPKLAAIIDQQPRVVTPVPIAPSAKKRPSLFISALVVAGVLFLGCGGCFTWIINGTPKATPEQKAQAKIESDEYTMGNQAKRELEQVITSILKAPTTAKYDLTAKVIRGESGRVIFVDGTVTSQNSFGAMLTNRVAGIYWRGNDEGANRVAFAQLEDKTLPVGTDELLDRCMQIAEENAAKK